MSQRRWLGPAIVFALALAVYLRTAPPGLTWAHDSADGGDLIAAALVGGVPHPSGYPTYMLIAGLFNRLPWHTPALRVTLISMLSGAAAAALVAATVQELAARQETLVSSTPVLRSASDEDTIAPAMTWRSSIVSSLLWTAPGILAGLTVAFTPLLWGQATVAEVYALHACLAALVIWALVRWRASGASSWTIVAGIAFGLALGNHLTSIWLAPVIGICLARPAGSSVGRSRAVVHFTLAAACGLLVYAYLPLAAAAHPAINWGNTQTPAGFWWLLSGKLYHSLVFAVNGPEALGRLSAWAELLWREFWPWGVVLALAGLTRLWQTDRTLAWGMLASFAVGLLWAIGYDTTDSILTLLPGWVMIGVWIGLGMFWLIGWLRQVGHRAVAIGVLIGLLLLAVPLARNWAEYDLSNDRRAEEFVSDLMQDVEPNALVVTVGDRATFALWYARYGLARRPDMIPVSRDLWSLESYRQTVGATHPALAGPEPPPELSTLLSMVQQRHPVYVTQVHASPADLAADDALLGSGLRLRQVERSVGLESPGWTLWKVEPPP